MATAILATLILLEFAPSMPTASLRSFVVQMKVVVIVVVRGVVRVVLVVVVVVVAVVVVAVVALTVNGHLVFGSTNTTTQTANTLCRIPASIHQNANCHSNHKFHTISN